MSMPYLILFFLGSAGLLFAARGSLRAGTGWYLLAALELLLILTLMQAAAWLGGPGGRPGAAPVGLGLLALALAVAGWLGRGARRGIYRFIRHPCYTAALVWGWGVFCQGLANVDSRVFLGACLLTCASLLLIAAARAQEAEQYARLGAEYADYLKSTKMFIPFLF